MNEEVSSKTNSNMVLILGDLKLDGVTDKIIALGHAYDTIKFLPDLFNIDAEKELSLKETMKKINQLRTSGRLSTLIMYLTEEVIFNTCGSENNAIWHHLLQEIKQTNSLIFVYEQNLFYKSFSKPINLVKEELKDLNNEDKTYVGMYETREPSKMLKDLKHCNYKLIDENRIIYFNALEFITVSNYIRLNIMLLVYKSRQKNLEAYKEEITQELKRVSQWLVEQEEAIEEKNAEVVQNAIHLLEVIETSGVEIVPYRINSDISIRAQQFLEEINQGIFLRLYVPYGRYQEDQLASFLRLFESYLQRVEKVQFFIENRKTLHGQIYEFKSKNTTMNLIDMEVAIPHFEHFMNLCQNDQKKAEALLLRTGINSSEANRLLTKYSKEYQRLTLDIEHERERKMLDLRQRLESEALELMNETSPSVPHSVQPSSLLSLAHTVDPVSITIANSSVIINPGIQNYVEQAIYGDIHYTTEDKELLNLFVKYAQGLEAVRLRSDLEQLKDTSLSEVERKTVKQKIAGFLSKVAPAIGQSALAVLTAYLEKVLTGL